jgi:hypothetical protein
MFQQTGFESLDRRLMILSDTQKERANVGNDRLVVQQRGAEVEHGLPRIAVSWDFSRRTTDQTREADILTQLVFIAVRRSC